MLTRARAYFGSYNISGTLSSWEANLQADTNEITTIEDINKKREGALKYNTLTGEGFWSSVPCAALRSNIGGTAEATTVCIGDGTIGTEAWLMNNITGTYKIGASVGDTFGYSFEGQGNGAHADGVTLMYENQTAVVTAEASAGQHLTTATGDIVVAHLHCTDFTAGTALTVVVQACATETPGTYANTHEFSVLGDIGHQRLTYTAVDTRSWYRVLVTTTTGDTVDITYAVALGI